MQYEGCGNMIKHKGTIELTTDRLKLRKYLLSDAENMFKNYANSLVKKEDERG